jgi:murein DD-endopeptidase MepM/ murein hydrolase activator NlpD
LYALTTAGIYSWDFTPITSPVGGATISGSTTDLTIVHSLDISPKSDRYTVGQEITAAYLLKNTGSSTITLEIVTVGGRLDETCPDNKCPDFTFEKNVSISSGEAHQYRGTLTLEKPGKYHFFCAYKRDGKWNTAIPTVTREITNTKDVQVDRSASDGDGQTSSGGSITVDYPVDKQYRKITMDFGADWTPWGTCNDKYSYRHTGVDFAAPAGTAVYAAADGTVAEWGSLGDRWKWYVVLDHDHKFTTSYLHLEKPMVHLGLRFRKGARLGTVAQMEGPHLHFGVRLPGGLTALSDRLFKGGLPYKHKENGQLISGRASCNSSSLYPWPDNFVQPKFIEAPVAQKQVTLNQYYTSPNFNRFVAEYAGDPWFISGVIDAWYVYGRIQELGLTSHSFLSTANDGKPIFGGSVWSWIDEAKKAGFTVDKSPRPHSIAMWENNAHVAFVESLENGSIKVTEAFQFNGLQMSSQNVVTIDSLELREYPVSFSSVLCRIPSFTILDALSDSESNYWQLRNNSYVGWTESRGPRYAMALAGIAVFPSSPMLSDPPDWYIHLGK